MTRRAGWACLAAATLFVSGVFAEQGVVKTRDGNSYEGDVTENETNVVIRIRGVDTVIQRADVASVERLGSYDDEFRARLGRLAANDVAGRIAMAREAFNRERYELARDTAEAALAIDPNSREAAEMLELVQSQLRLQRAKAESANATPAPPVAPATRPQVLQQGIERRLLTPADIQAIRRKELRLSDTSARIRFDGDVKKRFADSQNIPFPDFNARPTVEQAIMIMDHGDESMRSRVHVLSDPQSILEYRRQIQPLVMQNCATIGCHGGPGGGSLLLYTSTDNDAVTYTNFYILQSYTKVVEAATTAVFSGPVKKLVDRGHGDDSLLANYGLPATIGTYDHPLLNGRPTPVIFRNREDARYRMVVQWMNETLAPIQPDYGIHYTLPNSASPTTAPNRSGQ